MKKITLATVKSFIKKNKGKLLIRFESDFNGMTDGVEYISNPTWRAATEDPQGHRNTLGIHGAWFVFDSRDYFSQVKEEGYEGIHVYNCCGSFTLGVKTQ